MLNWHDQRTRKGTTGMQCNDDQTSSQWQSQNHAVTGGTSPATQALRAGQVVAGRDHPPVTQQALMDPFAFSAFCRIVGPDDGMHDQLLMHPP